MEKLNHDFEMLEMMGFPGFFVEDGLITYANTMARQRMIEVGASVSDLLLTGKQEYTDLSDGCLYLTLTSANTVYEASVTRMGSRDLFLLEHASSCSELQTLALAAVQLRQPLSEIMLAADEITEQTEGSDPVNHLNRGLYRLLRIIGNMSDASECLQSTPNMVICDVRAVFEEVLEQAKALLENAGITLTYTLPDRAIYSLLSKDMLFRAVYNLLSNASKYAVSSTEVKATLSRSGHLLYFTVAGRSDNISQLPANVFTRFLRQPGLEDGRNGIGLGMVLVHGFATSHGGTVLIKKTEDGYVHITMTMEVRKSGDATVRTSILKPDIYGGRNQGLVELSDILPDSLFDGKY